MDSSASGTSDDEDRGDDCCVSDLLGGTGGEGKDLFRPPSENPAKVRWLGLPTGEAIPFSL